VRFIPFAPGAENPSYELTTLCKHTSVTVNNVINCGPTAHRLYVPCTADYATYGVPHFTFLASAAQNYFRHAAKPYYYAANSIFMRTILRFLGHYVRYKLDCDFYFPLAAYIVESAKHRSGVCLSVVA